MKNENIILASSSPRRIEMMKAHGIKPVIIKPECEETLPENIGMADAVMFLSLKKALSVEALVLSQACPNTAEGNETNGTDAPYIIAADTVVYKDGIIGKPKDESDAFRILKKLKGSSHFVASGVTILQAGTARRRTFCEVTEVFFKDYSDEELAAYVKSDEPYDKAGGYAIQGTFGKYIDHIDGDMNNVIGFPWERIVREFEILRRM